VHENVFAVLARDKTITLGIVKPLDFSRFHTIHPFPGLPRALAGQA
jgi:hypothetical protein